MGRLLYVSLVFAVMLGIVHLESVTYADSPWKCSGDMCLRVEGRGSSVRGVDIRYSRTQAGCVSGRFFHRINESDGGTLGTWGDIGQFRICEGQTKSYFWTHAGSGAYVPAGGYVEGYFRQAGNNQTRYTPRIARGQF